MKTQLALAKARAAIAEYFKSTEPHEYCNGGSSRTLRDKLWRAGTKG